jgi:hypothetical protein
MTWVRADDLNSDGKPDLIVCSGTSPGLRVVSLNLPLGYR